MTKKLLIVSLALMAFSCKEAPKDKTEVSEKEVISNAEVKRDFPQALEKIFEAHGGISNWQDKKTLSFILKKDEGSETHTIDLRTRKEKITTADFAMGYNGQDYWLVDEQEKYKGNPVFYHNLMFYFYAMPFVLGDQGIVYSAAENMEFEGVSYPGIRIQFKDGVGISSKDEYFLYYDPETYQMAWLGYTVTFRTGEKSDKISYIRYNDWQQLSGLVLSNSLTWYKVEDGKPVAPASTRVFEQVNIEGPVKNAAFYDVPANGKISVKE